VLLKMGDSDTRNM